MPDAIAAPALFVLYTLFDQPLVAPDGSALRPVISVCTLFQLAAQLMPDHGTEQAAAQGEQTTRLAVGDLVAGDRADDTSDHGPGNGPIARAVAAYALCPVARVCCVVRVTVHVVHRDHTAARRRLVERVRLGTGHAGDARHRQDGGQCLPDHARISLDPGHIRMPLDRDLRRARLNLA